jgi:hypothetical protein
MALINPKQYIISARSNGYKDTAYAIAELTDNSIQANANSVEILIFENERRVIDKIAIADNGEGMDSDLLAVALGFGESGRDKDKQGNLQNHDKLGMGKFGMGLPNASVSQCKRVEVWSWKNKDDVYYTYLDVNEIIDETYTELPLPIKQPLPAKYQKAAFDSELPDSGTFVLWSDLDKLKWKRSRTLFEKSEFEIGRMYRNFLNAEKCKVQFRVFDENGNKKEQALDGDGFIKPNDPLYLMEQTSLPPLPGMHQDESQSCFEIVEDKPISVSYKGDEHLIRIRSSVARSEVLKRMLVESEQNSVGDTSWGKHCAKNIGLSVMRAGRELELNSKEFFGKGEIYQIRWTGIEIDIPPSLDEVFGVTNNKQHANNLKDYSLEAVLDNNNKKLETIMAVDKFFRENGDEESAILYVVTKELNDSLAKLRKKVKQLPLNKVKPNDPSVDINGRASAALTDVFIDREETHPGRTLSQPADYKGLQELLVKAYGYNPEDAKKVADQMASLKSIITIQYKTNSNHAFFDVDHLQGITVLNINPEHDLYKRFLSKMNEHDEFIFKIILGAWARLEDEAITEIQQTQYERARNAWGEMLEDTFEKLDLDGLLDSNDEL